MSTNIQRNAHAGAPDTSLAGFDQSKTRNKFHIHEGKKAMTTLDLIGSSPEIPAQCSQRSRGSPQWTPLY